MKVGRVIAKTPVINGWDPAGVCSLDCSWSLTSLKVSALEVVVVRSEVGGVEVLALDGSRKMGQRIANLQSASCPAAHLKQSTEQERDRMIYSSRAA
jgi:hypothetical protein